MSILTATVLTLVVGCGDARAVEPFAATELLPADVPIFIHLEGAGAIRRSLDARPIGRWIEASLEEGPIGKAWSSLATEIGEDPVELFDTCLGESLTVALRRVKPAAGMDGESIQWAVLTEMKPAAAARIVKVLRPRLLAPRHSMAIHELPEQRLILALRDSTVLVGPAEQPRLFDEVMACMGTEGGPRLADDPALTEAARLGGGCGGMLIRHKPPLGGFSLATVQLTGNELIIRHVGEFERSPFTRKPSAVEWNDEPLEAVSRTAAITLIEPTDTGDSRFETYLHAALGQPLLTGEMRANIGARRMIAIGHQEGQQDGHSSDLLVPTIAQLYEVRNAKAAIEQFDKRMIGLAKQLNRLGGGAYAIDVPQADAFEAGEPRSIDISPAATHLLGAMPGASGVHLCWDVVAGDSSIWAIVASDMDHVRDLAASLINDGGELGRSARLAHVGCVRGQRLVEPLLNWRNHAQEFAGGPNEARRLAAALQSLALLAEGIERCEWRTKCMGGGRVEIEVRIRLSEPASAGGEQP